MTDYTKLVKALRDIGKTMLALGTTNISMDNVSISLAYDKGWGQTANDAADAIEELLKNFNMASQELSWTISYAMHLVRDIDELHDMVNEVYYDEL